MISKIIILGAIVAIVVGAIGYVYFGVVSPAAEKPVIEKPALLEGQNVDTEHIRWLANELGAYKIHSSLSSEEAQIEIVVEGVPFAVTNGEGGPIASDGKAENPDIRITAGRASFGELMAAQNIKSKIVELYDSGKIGVELLKDQAALALKGYKSIYDQING